MNELSLIIFSILLQSAVGFSIMFFLYRRTILADVKGDFLTWTMFGIAATAAVGLLISSTHMNYPLNAPYALTNFWTSWLSREAIFAPAFIGLVGILFLMSWSKRVINSHILGIAAVAGAFDVFCLANIYRSSSILTWSTNYSIALHVGGMLLLGSLVAIVYLSRLSQTQSKVITQLLLMILVIMVIRAITQVDLLTNLDVRQAAQGLMFPWDSVSAFYHYFPILLAGWIFGIVGAVLIVFYLIHDGYPRTKKTFFSPVLVAIIGMVTLYELLCRVHFYLFNI
ncbi:dimethyl sulfoxide reductase anchor subunit [Photobacterium sagamiensis]|uniref:dimethyl sulfoxide reductase anchor subunit family protein n=1 Tax=Photobacterium sagamiensis TaxID=2910241 RepID=UPI003D0AF6EF